MKGKETKAPPPPKVFKAEIQGKEQNYLVDIVIVRLVFAITLTLVAYFIQPFGFSGLYTIVLGLTSAVGIIYFEHRLKRATLKRLIGGAGGSIMCSTASSVIRRPRTDSVVDTTSLSF